MNPNPVHLTVVWLALTLCMTCLAAPAHAATVEPGLLEAHRWLKDHPPRGVVQIDGIGVAPSAGVAVFTGVHGGADGTVKTRKGPCGRVAAARDVWVMPLPGGAPKRLTKSRRGHSAVLSPDRSRLAYIDKDRLYVANPDGSRATLIARPGPVPKGSAGSRRCTTFHGLAWSPAGHFLGWAVDDGAVRGVEVVHLASGQRARFDADAVSVAWGLDYSLTTRGADSTAGQSLSSTTIVRPFIDSLCETLYDRSLERVARTRSRADVRAKRKARVDELATCVRNATMMGRGTHVLMCQLGASSDADARGCEELYSEIVRVKPVRHTIPRRELLDGRRHTDPTSPAPGGAATTGPRSEVAMVIRPSSAEVEGITRVFRRRRGALKHCHERALQREPTLAGTLSLSLTVGTLGRVTRLDPVANDTGDQTLQRCIETRMKRWRFPPADEAVRVTVDITLTIS